MPIMVSEFKFSHSNPVCGYPGECAGTLGILKRRDGATKGSLLHAWGASKVGEGPHTLNPIDATPSFG